MGSKLEITVIDYEKEFSKMQFKGAALTAANMVAQEAAMTALEAAALDLQLGTERNKNITANVVKFAPLNPGSVNAQRERKWLIAYYDAVTFEQFTMEIPCADLSLLDTDAQDGSIDKTVEKWTTFKSAFQAYVLSPLGNAVVVTDAFHVGRNL
jgi:hypothetical protein